MVPLFLLFGFSLLPRGPGKQRGEIEEAMRRFRGPKEEDPGRNRVNPGKQRGKILKIVSFVPQYSLFVPGVSSRRPNLPGVFEEKNAVRPRFWRRPSQDSDKPVPFLKNGVGTDVDLLYQLMPKEFSLRDNGEGGPANPLLRQ